MGENPVNPAPAAVPNSVDNNFPTATPQMEQAVDPAMPNAMGVTMNPANPNPVVDPDVAPNPFENSVNAAGQPASVGAQPVNPVIVSPKPEVVTSGNGGRSNTPWIVLGVMALVVVVGALGAFAYFSFVAVNPVEVAPTPAPVTEVKPTPIPTPRAMTIDEKMAVEESSMNDLQSSLSAVDKGLSDKQGDLSE